MGAGGGAGGGSYTGSLRPAGPQQSGGSSFAQGTGWSGTPPAAAPGGGGGIVRKGYVGVKEDGIRSWIWSKRWLALREQTLTFHKNEVSCSRHAQRGPVLSGWLAHRRRTRPWRSSSSRKSQTSRAPT
jgi:hypothetical protein